MTTAHAVLTAILICASAGVQRNKPPRPGSYIRMTVIDKETEQPVGDVRLRVEQEYDPPHEYYDYQFDIQLPGTPDNVFFTMPPRHSGNPRAFVTAMKPGYDDSEPLVVTSAYYWEHLGRHGDFFLEHTFVLEKGSGTADRLLAESQKLPRLHRAATLQAKNRLYNDHLGSAVAVDDETIVIGAPHDGEKVFGAAHVFRSDGSRWLHEAKLTASDASTLDKFGCSVAVSGDVIAVGTDRGKSAYLFRYDGSTWTQEAALRAPDDYFGRSVAVSGTLALVGSPRAAYVFRYDGSTWSQDAKLVASDARKGDVFGARVAVDADVALVSAVGGKRVYIFRYDGSTWVQEAKLAPSDGIVRGSFGWSIAISGTVAAVGPDIFRYDGSQWLAEGRLRLPGNEKTRDFGCSIDVVGDTALVGACSDDETGFSDGAAFVFRFNGERWQPVAKLIAPDRSVGGWSRMRITDEVAVVGTHIFSLSHHDGNADGLELRYTRADQTIEAPVSQAEECPTSLRALRAEIRRLKGRTAELTESIKALRARRARVDREICRVRKSLMAQAGKSELEPRSSGECPESLSSVPVAEARNVRYRDNAEPKQHLGGGEGGPNPEEYAAQQYQQNASDAGRAAEDRQALTDVAGLAGSLQVLRSKRKLLHDRIELMSQTLGRLNGEVAKLTRATWISPGHIPTEMCDAAMSSAHKLVALLDNLAQESELHPVEAEGSRDAACDQRLRSDLEVMNETRADRPVGCRHTKLTATDGAKDDKFGQSVSVDGQYAVVGAYGADNTCSYGPCRNAGAAYVFRRDRGTWLQQAKLAPEDLAMGDGFGVSVSINGDYVLVGDHGQLSHAGPHSDAAYVFKRHDPGTPHDTGDDSWRELARLVPDESTGITGFGWSVSISDDRALIGAPYDGTGSAYVFKREGDTWLRQAKLTATDAASGSGLGWSVSLKGDLAVLGASSGSAYVFRRGGTDWVQQATLTAGDTLPADFFGASVSTDGQRAIVGAPNAHDVPCGFHCGSAYVFVRHDGGTPADLSDDSWIKDAKLLAADVAPGDAFGHSVAINGAFALVGARQDSRGPGAIYVFWRDDKGTATDRSDDSWIEAAKLSPPDGAKNDQFGRSVAMADDHVIIGAIYDDDSGESSGSAYAYCLSALGCGDLNDVLMEGVEEPDVERAYVGSAKCRMCHIKQHNSWKRTGKSRSLNALKAGKVVEVKKQCGLDPENDYTRDENCLKCHVTGYGRPGGYAVPDTADERAVKRAARRAHVGCESCHGPGSEYVKLHKEIKKSRRMYNVEEMYAAGMVPQDASVCAHCHSNECPIHDESKEFQYDGMKGEAVHVHRSLAQRRD